MLALLLAALGSFSGDQPASLAFRTYQIVRSDLFVPLNWMIGELLSPPKGGPATGDGTTVVQQALDRRAEAQRLERELNRRYGATAVIDPALARATIEAEQEAGALEPAAVSALAGQISSELQGEGLTLVPHLMLPPVNFRFTPLPYVLVLSPRQRIYRSLTVTLRGDLTLREVETIEEQVSKLGYSALITPIGGLGAYPSMLPRTSNVENTLVTVAHEWAHHYFFFRPLGWRYGLGLENDGDVITINETAAGYIGREIGGQAFARYYGGPPLEDAHEETASDPNQPEDEFPRLMRETRQAVDTMLAAGLIEEAERYMERQRFYLADRGYRLRKLNQAYFAFYGSYADRPGFTANPIGEKLRRLRSASPSLRAFVERVAGMSSAADLDRAVEAIP
jgi:hypothetical protein